MNIHAAAAYVAHLLTARSTAGHGVHSPLMYSFITEVIGGRTDAHIMNEISNLRREMLSDSRVVRVTDLGAGSSVMQHRERSIRQIARIAALPSREAALLMRIAASLDRIMGRVPEQQASGPQAAHRPDDHRVILELGTSLGISTLALALGAPHRRVITVEGCPELAAIARENLRRHGADNTEVLNMEFRQAIAHLKSTGTKIDMAFIDGNHRGTALIDYTQRITEMGDKMIIVADDIHLNSDMIRAWRSLCTGQQTPLTAGSTGEQAGQRQASEFVGARSQWAPSEITSGAQSQRTPPENVAGEKPPFSSPASDSPVTASLETLRLGILFCLHNLTPGHYRIRY